MHIGPTAFFAKGLTSAVIPEGVLTIEDGYVDPEDVGSSYGAFGLNFGTEENPFSITFPGSLTYIGVGACAITTLTSVSTGDGVTEIADFAFAECNWLESLTLGQSVERIGWAAFFNCALSEFIGPDSLRFIGVSAFARQPDRNLLALAQMQKSNRILQHFERIYADLSQFCPAGMETIEIKHD